MFSTQFTYVLVPIHLCSQPPFIPVSPTPGVADVMAWPIPHGSSAWFSIFNFPFSIPYGVAPYKTRTRPHHGSEVGCCFCKASMASDVMGGPGGSRTPVQTRKPYAFYMLIFAFGFRAAARPKPPTVALAPTDFTQAPGQGLRYSRFCCAALSNASEQGLLSDIPFLPLGQELR